VTGQVEHSPAGIAVRPDAAFERTWLDDASWVDVARGWLGGADDLYDVLAEGMPWRQERIFRYERYALEPRLGAVWAPGRPSPAADTLVALHRAVRQRYGKPFTGFSLAWYRDGRDSVAFHRDRDLRHLEDTVIVLLTLGARRPWLLRPRSSRYDHGEGRGAQHDLAPASGDLLAMGGRTQVGWEHSVPKVRQPVRGRISLQWRWTSRRGRPEVGASYRAPRTFSRGPGSA
jgi:alkylated DNA repair dioxygenase AlkB